MSAASTDGADEGARVAVRVVRAVRASSAYGDLGWARRGHVLLLRPAARAQVLLLARASQK